jgi:hypothetical protein
MTSMIAAKDIRPVLAAAVLLLLGAGCRSREKPKGRYDGVDGGYTMREECDVPSSNCHRSCIKREASLACTGCCRDQRFLCDTGQKHSFEYCEGAQ